MEATSDDEGSVTDGNAAAARHPLGHQSTGKSNRRDVMTQVHTVYGICDYSAATAADTAL
jgi:hypothetical protein